LLRSVDYRDADRIVTLLTDRHGKVSLLARGARSSQRRFAGALEPFSVLDAELSLGRGELGQLRSAQVVQALPRILGDLRRMSAAGSALALLREVVPERAPDPAIFESALQMLCALDEPAARPDTLLLAFDVHLMTLAGFAPGLSACGVCGKRPAPGQAAELDATRGFIVCRACGGAAHHLSGAIREWLVQAQADDFQVREAPPFEANEVLATQRALVAFIEHRIERPIEQGVHRLG
jgi:DNA repair protein RecO (recombination protein O)